MSNEQKTQSSAISQNVLVGVSIAIIVAIIMGAFTVYNSVNKNTYAITEMSDDFKEIKDLPAAVLKLENQITNLENRYQEVEKRSQRLIIEVIKGSPESAPSLLSSIALPSEVIEGVTLYQDSKYLDSIETLGQAAINEEYMARFTLEATISSINQKIDAGEIKPEDAYDIFSGSNNVTFGGSPARLESNFNTNVIY